VGKYSGGGQSHVFEVLILSRTYALKVVRESISKLFSWQIVDNLQFKYYDHDHDWAGLSHEDREEVGLELFCAHMDPFFNECRAYGRLIDKNQNGKAAVCCYGYLTLPTEREDELRRDFGVVNWDRPKAEYSEPAHKRQPLRAIVKDLITEDVRITPAIGKKILTALRRMRKIGIYPMDTRVRNYKGGKVIDFSVAITEPHVLFVINDSWRVEDYKRCDLLLFDEMMEKEEAGRWQRATRDEKYVSCALRPRDDTGRVPKKKQVGLGW